MEVKKGQVIIFDLDGTIADSIPTMLNIIHELLHRGQYKEDISRLRGKSSLQVLRELKVPLWRAYFLIAKARKRITRYIDTIPIVPGMDDAVRKLAGEYVLYIVSANSAANVQAFLQRFGLEKSFAYIYGGVAPWRKRHALRWLARVYGFSPERSWYVGDEDLDVKAAHQAGMRAVAVSWGFSNIHILKTQRPEILVFDSGELIRRLMAELTAHG
jgi:phosphoglycolate phosphatase